MQLNENHGQVNVNCDVINEAEARLPLRPDALMRECPSCVALSPIYSPQCTNCGTDFEQHRLHLRYHQLTAQLAASSALKDKVSFAFVCFAGISLGSFYFQLIELGVLCSVITYILLRATGDTAEMDALKAEIEEVRSRLWI